MRNKLVYDLPTRFFHWLFSGLFVSAFVIAKTVDDESVVFSYHSLMGLVLGFLILLRLVWGVVGTQNARFSNFALNPKDLIAYLKGIKSGEKKKWAGHNPASSWAAVVMLLMGVGLVMSGYLMTSGRKPQALEEVHEICGNIFVLTAVLHVLGILLHTLRYKDLIGLSMVDGKKSEVSSSGVIASSQPIPGMILLALVAAFSIQIINGFDVNAQSLSLFGQKLQIGEVEKKEKSEAGAENERDNEKNEGEEHEGKERSEKRD